MTKRIEIPQPEETVTIPKSSFDNIFRVMEQMRQEIAELHKVIAAKEPTEDVLFNANEAAAYCGVVRQTIYAWRREKRIRAVVRKGKRGFLKSELDKIREC